MDKLAYSLRTERASRVVADKRPLVAVHVSVLGDTGTPRGSKRASRMIAGKRSGSSVKPFQMNRQIGLRRRRILTSMLRTFEDDSIVSGRLVTLHVSSGRKAGMVPRNRKGKGGDRGSCNN